MANALSETAVVHEGARQRLGERIRTLRLQRALTGSTCARAAGISRQAWSVYESGRASPGALMLFRIADALGCSADDLRPCDRKPVECASARDGRLNRVPLTRRERHCLQWLAEQVPGLFTGATFRPDAVLAGCEARRGALRRLLRQLEGKGLLIFEPGGFRLAKSLQQPPHRP